MLSRKARPATPTDVVRQAVDAMNARDSDRLRRLSHRGFMAFPATPFLAGDPAPYTGRDALTDWVADLMERWASFELSVSETRQRGDRVYCHEVMKVTPKRIAAPVHYDIHLVWETRAGKLVSVRSYGGDRSAALGAL